MYETLLKEYKKKLDGNHSSFQDIFTSLTHRVEFDTLIDMDKIRLIEELSEYESTK
jgi:hypothetical protein